MNINVDSVSGTEPSVIEMDPRYRTIHLLKQLRETQHQISDCITQNFKYEISNQFKVEQKQLLTDDSVVLSVMNKISKQIPLMLQDIDCINSFIIQNPSSSDDKNEAINSRRKISFSLPPVKLDCDQITNFRELIKYISELFEISNEDEYSKKNFKLWETLNVLKDYEVSVEHLNYLQKRYKEINNIMTTIVEL